MDYFIIFGILVSTASVLLVLLVLITFEILYLFERRRKYKNYTFPLNANCTKISKKVITIGRKTSDPLLNYEEYHVVECPVLVAKYEGRLLKFCRPHDVNQPKVKEGQKYTIYINPQTEFVGKYFDYMEESELLEWRGLRIHYKYIKKIVWWGISSLLFLVVFLLLYGIFITRNF